MNNDSFSVRGRCCLLGIIPVVPMVTVFCASAPMSTVFFVCVFAGIVHENPRIGSDGESEEVSGASDDKDDAISPVKLRHRPGGRRSATVSHTNLVLPCSTATMTQWYILT